LPVGELQVAHAASCRILPVFQDRLECGDDSAQALEGTPRLDADIEDLAIHS
jgi:hypothetical protein